MKPNRTNLSVPGHIAKMHSKAAESDADVIMLDLEDSVPIDEKENARKTVVDSIKSFDWSKKTLSVRINQTDSSFAYEDLVYILENTKDAIDSIVIPKVNHPKDVYAVDFIINGIMKKFFCVDKIKIEASIESAEGLENISAIAKSSKRLKSLVFGIADYSASVGAKLVSMSGHGEKEDSIYPGHRWHFVISKIVMSAKANSLLAIDAPYGNFKDAEGLRRSSVMAAALGCDGKWVIHPSQIKIVNDVFSPSSEDIKRASKILDAHNEAKKKCLGATCCDGSMIDMATVRMAEKLYSQAKFLKLI